MAKEDTESTESTEIQCPKKCCADKFAQCIGAPRVQRVFRSSSGTALASRTNSPRSLSG